MAGKIVHFEIPAGDAGRAKAFWSGVFGWEFGDSAMPDMEYYMVRTGEDQGGAILPSEARCKDTEGNDFSLFQSDESVEA